MFQKETSCTFASKEFASVARKCREIVEVAIPSIHCTETRNIRSGIPCLARTHLLRATRMLPSDICRHDEKISEGETSSNANPPSQQNSAATPFLSDLSASSGG
jgi:hypothetical protein